MACVLFWSAVSFPVMQRGPIGPMAGEDGE